MRINGFEQIKAFYSWTFENHHKVRQSHISLYMFILNQCNRSNWSEWIKLPYDLAMQGAAIGSKSTYYKTLDELQSFNLIDYKKGINNYKAPQIHLICLSNSVPLPVPLPVPLTVPLTVPLPVPLTGNIYKLLTDNIKRITDNLEDVIVFLDSINESKAEVIHQQQHQELILWPSFQDFWDLYDKKTDSKVKCEKKWNRLSQNIREEIMQHLPYYVMSTPDKQYRKNPSTYLNNHGWTHEIIQKNNRNGKLYTNGAAEINEFN